MNNMKNRAVDYLRLSVTDKCNLNCLYCAPFEKSGIITANEILSYEEVVRLVGAFVKKGVRALRLTGGEPLLRRDIVGLIRMLKNIKGLQDISLTTNAVLLKNTAYQLKSAGLDRVNISLDSLKKERFAYIVGSDIFDDVWAGIQGALDAGLHPVKLNTVIMKGINDDEILDLAGLAYRFPLTIRFIEFFPTNSLSRQLTDWLIDNNEVKAGIEASFGRLQKILEARGSGPAEYYKPKGSKGLIGFISSSSRNFCKACNRIRVDCAGRISPCLFSGAKYELGKILRKLKSDDELTGYIEDVLKMKPKYNKNNVNAGTVEMCTLGG